MWKCDADNIQTVYVADGSTHMQVLPSNDCVRLSELWQPLTRKLQAYLLSFSADVIEDYFSCPSDCSVYM